MALLTFISRVPKIIIFASAMAFLGSFARISCPNFTLPNNFIFAADAGALLQPVIDCVLTVLASRTGWISFVGA